VSALRLEKARTTIVDIRVRRRRRFRGRRRRLRRGARIQLSPLNLHGRSAVLLNLY